MEDAPNLLYGVNLGRIPIGSRKQLLESLRAPRDSLGLSREQAENLASIAEDQNLFTYHCEWNNQPSESGLDYDLSQIHIGEEIGNGIYDLRPKRGGNGIDTGHEAPYVDTDHLTELLQNPADLLRRIRRIGVNAQQKDLAFYAADFESFLPFCPDSD